MNDFQYCLNSSLPFDLDSASPEADRLFKAASDALPEAVGRLNAWDSSQEDVVKAYDTIGEWIAANWRTVLPEISAPCKANH